jgi:hypothetical protein
MNFKLLSKNNIGVVVALLLVILLSQSKFFNFLLESTLGRSILVLFVLVLAYVNKILGVVAVLFIIIIFNQSNIGYLEGFTDASGNTVVSNKIDASGNSVASTHAANQQARIAERTDERQKIRQNVKANIAAKAATTVPATAPATTTATTPVPTTATPAVLTGGAEGFDIIGTENYIKRGKQSNQIPVSEHMRESMEVSAFDGSFSDNYSAF